MMISSDDVLAIVAAFSFVWPVCVATLNRATMSGKTDERLKNIERDIKEIRDYFVLTPRQHPPS